MRPSLTPDLRAFGRRAAEAQDEALREKDALRQARAMWLAPGPAGRRGPPKRDWSLWGGMAAAAALGAAACVLFLVKVPSPPLAFEVGPSEEAAGAKGKPGVVGELVAAPEHERLPVRFSDGSVVRLEPDARARFVEVTDQGSRVLLEGGSARASVVHKDDTRWTVQAGPYEVRVTGTQFDVAWDPPRGLFTITLLEGRVIVSGCAMEHARTVSAGETFQTRCKGEEAERAPAPSAASAFVPATPPPPLEATRRGSAIARVAAPPPAPHPTWQELLALGRYAEAFDAADAAGLTSICASAESATLMDLSDAARFAGHADRAKVVLLAVRRRFAGDERASAAAFNLGRIAFDDESDYAGAARWFGAYLLERPGGPLAREASGRRMESLERGGNHAAAQTAAKSYLEAYPTGPHAELARSIANR